MVNNIELFELDLIVWKNVSKIIYVIFSVIARTIVKKILEMFNLILNRQNSKPGCTKLLRNDTTITNINDIAEAFNNYLTNVAVNISSEIPHNDIDFRDFLQYYNFTDTFFLPPLTPSENKEITLGLKLTCGGHQEIPANMFKIIIDLNSVPLSKIFN